jgi:hypothetical protein
VVNAPTGLTFAHQRMMVTMLLLLFTFLKTATSMPPPERHEMGRNKTESLDVNSTYSANSALNALVEGVTLFENSLSSGVNNLLGGFGKLPRHHSNSTVRMQRRLQLLSNPPSHSSPVLLVAVLSDINDFNRRVTVRETWGRFTDSSYWKQQQTTNNSPASAIDEALWRRDTQTADLTRMRFFVTESTDRKNKADASEIDSKLKTESEIGDLERLQADRPSGGNADAVVVTALLKVSFMITPRSVCTLLGHVCVVRVRCSCAWFV